MKIVQCPFVSLGCLGVVYGPLTTLGFTDWAHQERFAVAIGTALGKATCADIMQFLAVVFVEQKSVKCG
jgi:hypothetical protein